MPSLPSRNPRRPQGTQKPETLSGFFGKPEGESDYERRIARGRAAAAARDRAQIAAQTPQREPGWLERQLQAAHGVLDPTQYFGGPAETALAGLPAGKVVSGLKSAASRFLDAPRKAKLTREQADFLTKQFTKPGRKRAYRNIDSLDPDFMAWKQGQIPKAIEPAIAGTAKKSVTLMAPAVTTINAAQMAAPKDYFDLLSQADTQTVVVENPEALGFMADRIIVVPGRGTSKIDPEKVASSTETLVLTQGQAAKVFKYLGFEQK